MMNLDIVEKYNMLPKGSRVLCAVSGGADSMCLLHLLHSRRSELGLEVFAAHYEHGLRGQESLRDASFVQSFCQSQGIVCLLEHGQAGAFAKEKGLGVEEAARQLRYDFLQRAAEQLSCTRIATAHNADDNVETMLFNLCRGSGTAGLRGIPPVRGNIVRPLLSCTRVEIEDYLKANNLPHVEDSSNLSDDYSRNLIRHRVMPELRELNPALARAAGRAAGLLREDESFLEDKAEEFIAENFDGQSIGQREFAGLHRAVASRVVRKLCCKSLSLEHVEAALALGHGNGLAYVSVPGQKLRREQGRIYFKAGESGTIQERQLVIGEKLLIPEAKISMTASVTCYNKEINDLFKTLSFKYENLCGNIVCTGRRHGDSLRILGRGCTKSLKSLFNEAGMTQSQRDSCPVLRDEKGILAVYGLAIAERAAAKPGEKILRIDIETQ